MNREASVMVRGKVVSRTFDENAKDKRAVEIVADYWEVIGKSSPDNITSFADNNNFLPKVPPGCDLAKSSGLKSLLFINDIASASPQTRVAVALEVGARSRGHASFSTFIN